MAHLQKAGLGLRDDENFDEVAEGDGRDQHQHDGLDVPHAVSLQGEQEQHVAGGDDHGPEEGDVVVGEQVDGDGAAEDFGQVAGADRQFAKQPVGPAGPVGIPVAAALGEILAGDDAEPGGDDLEEDGHQAGEGDDPEQVVFELSAALEVGAPVAGVHVADADQQGGADVGAPLFPEGGAVVGDATVPCMPSRERWR